MVATAGGLPVAVLLALLTLFFSVINVALRHISWVKLQEAFESRGCAERTRIMRDHLPRLTSSAAILRLLANLGLLLCVVYYFSAHGEPGDLLPLVAAFGVAAVVLLVLSVAVPLAWAQYAGTTLLVVAFPLLCAMEYVTWPLTTMLGLFDPVIRRLAGITADNDNNRLEEKQEELLNVVEEGQKEGVVDEEEREMIASVLEFRGQTAGEIMTPRTDVVGIDATAAFPQAVQTITETGHSRYPVYEQSIDQVLGMLYAKDLLRDLNQPDAAEGIRHRLRKAYFVPESKPLRDLLHDFQNQKVHLAVVLDEYGGTAGVVTIEDILEELVGEIVDEYEPPQEEPIKRIDQNTIEVDARVHVDELNDDFDLQLPEDEDYETIGGFAFSKLGSIPRTGEAFEHENLLFTVIDVEQRKINRLRIVMRPKAAPPANGSKKSDASADRTGGNQGGD